jgi:glycosyltransferase involved in cell wall biosynthesis
MRRYSENTASLPRKIAARRTAQLLERSELMLLRQGKAHTVVSERERQKLLSRLPHVNISVVPNGVDVNFFSRPPTSANRENQRSASSRSTIVFVGSMDYHANIDGAAWFAREAWPAIAERHPTLEFVIVGRSPSKEVLALASDRIRVTGTVDDVRPYYACAIASVVPLRVGGGTRLKILEAMAAGVPVVSTALGAEGLDAVPNTHYLLANRPTDVVEAITLVHDLATRDRIVEAARAFARSRYDWSILGEKLYQTHSELVPQK